MKSKYGLSRHAASAKRLSVASGAATGGACSPWRRCRVEAQRSTNCLVSAVCAANARWGSAHVIFGDTADGAHHFANIIGDRDLDLAALPWSQISGQRLAAVLDRPRDVVRERLHIGGGILAARAGRLGGSRRRRSVPRRLGRRGGGRQANGLRGSGCGLNLAWASPFSLATLRRRCFRLRNSRCRGRPQPWTPAGRLAAGRFSCVTV